MPKTRSALLRPLSVTVILRLRVLELFIQYVGPLFVLRNSFSEYPLWEDWGGSEKSRELCLEAV